jgi:hypothetical protein
MPKMVVTHAVVEIERWLQGKDERAAAIGKYATNVTDYVAADGSNNVAITADIHDMAGLQALMASPRPRTQPPRSATASSNPSWPTSRSSPVEKESRTDRPETPAIRATSRSMCGDESRDQRLMSARARRTRVRGRQIPTVERGFPPKWSRLLPSARCPRTFRGASNS